MPSIDMPLDQLRQYKPALTRENDFEDFWKSTLAESARQPLHAEFIPYDLPTKDFDVFAVRYDGFQGGTIAGWYVRPHGRGKFPGLCIYHGYSGRAPRPLELMRFAAQGIATMSVDVRGQSGESQDLVPYPTGHCGGWMTLGITDPRTYHYRYVFTDSVRALDVLAKREEVDESRLAITGGSQGGGITLAVAALSKRPLLAMPDIPFLCHYKRAVEIAGNGPYPEIAYFIKQYPARYEQVYRTLSYCDNLNLAPMIRCRTVVMAGLCDDVCPPSTIFGMYNHIAAEKQIEVYPYHKHETPYEHAEKRFRLLMEVLRP